MELSMKKQEILEWLDRVVELHKELLDFQKEYKDKGMVFFTSEYVHVDECIEYLAAAVGESLSCEVEKDCEYPYKYSFMYKDMKIIQLCTRELSAEVHWDEN